MLWSELIKFVYETEGGFHVKEIPPEDRRAMIDRESLLFSRLLTSSAEQKSASLAALLFSTTDRASATCRQFIDNFFDFNSILYRANPVGFVEKVLHRFAKAEWELAIMSITEPSTTGVIHRIVLYPFGFEDYGSLFFLMMKPRDPIVEFWREKRLTDIPMLFCDWRVPILTSNMINHFVAVRETVHMNSVCTHYSEPALGRSLFQHMREPVLFMLMTEFVLLESDVKLREGWVTFIRELVKKFAPEYKNAIGIFESINFNSEKKVVRKEVFEKFSCLIKSVRPWCQFSPTPSITLSPETPRSSSNNMSPNTGSATSSTSKPKGKKLIAKPSSANSVKK